MIIKPVIVRPVIFFLIDSILYITLFFFLKLGSRVTTDNNN